MIDDLISRQDAIDTLEEHLDYLQKLNKDENPKAESEWYGVNWARNTIADLPSAQPEVLTCGNGELDAQSEQLWILCSERLPDNGDIVIVSIRDETGDTKFNYSSYGWITTNKEYWIVDNEINNYVVAWMPLPYAYEDSLVRRSK